MPALLRCLCLLLCLFPLVGRAQQVPSDFRLTHKVGTPISFPYGVAVDRQGAMYVLDRGYITKLDAQGNYLSEIDLSSPDPAKPHGSGYSLCLDATGNLYVADFTYSQVLKYSPDGRLLLKFSTGGYSTTGAYGLPQPENVRVDAAGNIYVVKPDRSGLHKFNAQGQRQWVFTAPGNTNSQWINTEDVAFDAAGSAFVLLSDFSVCQLDTAGQTVTQFPLVKNGYRFGGPQLTIDSAGNFYTVGSQDIISKYDRQGRFVGTLRDDPYTLGNSTRTALATDGAGNIYATTRHHSGGSQLLRFDAAGKHTRSWGNLAYYRYPVQDGEGNILVFDGRQVIKRDAAGRELLRFGAGGAGASATDEPWQVLNLACDATNNLYALEVAGQGSRLRKFSPQGQVLGLIQNAELPAPPSMYSDEAFGLAVDPIGRIWVSYYYGGELRQFDQQGRQLRTLGTWGTAPGQLRGPRAIGVDGRGFVYVTDQDGYRVQKFSPTGQLLWLKTTKETYYPGSVSTAGLSVATDGTVAVGTTREGYVQLYDASGQQGRKLPFSAPSLSLNRAGTRLIATYSDVLHLYSATTPASNRRCQISGRIFQDPDLDCQPQTAAALSNIVVVAEPGNYYGMSDENGNYTIDADTGSYTVRQLLPNDPGRTIRQTCVSQSAVRLPAYDMRVAGPDFGNQISATPYLNISVASNRRRRCFRNSTSVSYANTGFAAARGARVAVKLPEHVVFISANVPHTRDAQGNYWFAVGDLAPAQHGQISIIDSVACGNEAIRGLTVCTKAWMTPGNPVPLPALWQEGSVAVRGQAAVDGKVRFAVVNRGRGATGDSLALRLYADATLVMNQKYALAAGDSLVLRVPATSGQALRLAAEQPAHHPFGPEASAVVEAGPRPAGQPNAAALMMPPASAPLTTAENCQPIVDSYDPNDKQVVPTGVTAEHYTPTNTPLQYQVRFQNTGSDVAYRVEVVDTLSTDLDMRTLKVGAASHSYRLRVSGKEKPVLTFTFDNIMLPEQKRDDAGSNGFVQFSIRPKADLAPKTRIDNLADIFFDYNSPIRTNTTTNRIYDLPPVVNLTSPLTLPALVTTPQLLNFSPQLGSAGTIVTLSGQHFAGQASGNQVTFNGVAAQVLSATPNLLTVQVPSGAATGKITVITADGGTGSSTDFQVAAVTSASSGIAADALTIHPNPAPKGAATLSWQRASYSVQQVRLFDAHGGLLLTYYPSPGSTTQALPLAGQAPGLYLVLIQTSAGLVRKRLTVL